MKNKKRFTGIRAMRLESFVEKGKLMNSGLTEGKERQVNVLAKDLIFIT